MTISSGATIWIEVDDFIRYFDGSVTPTGIGRVQSQILACLAATHASRVRFCRIGKSAREIEILGYADVERLADGNEFLSRYSRDNRLLPLFQLRRFLARRLAASARILSRGRHARSFAAAVRPGDVLMNLGASWTHRNFARTIAQLKRDFGLRFALLVHDVLPVSHSSYVDPGHIPTFSTWLAQMAQVWDFVMTPSRSSATALANHLAGLRLPIPETRVIPFGAGFGVPTAGAPDIPLPERTHVLYVSTIEIRKNHMLLFHVWQRLIREHGADAVPDLVFAGKYGWEIKDLRQVLKETSFLDGKIRVVENLSDEALAVLYRSSLFTVFPSFCEGWGLPVAESLFYGRHCIASDATSIPEVGGRFVQYHDPRDVDAAYRLVETAIFDRSALGRFEGLIGSDFRPAPWQATADAIVAAVDDFTAGAAASTPGASAVALQRAAQR